MTDGHRRLLSMTFHRLLTAIASEPVQLKPADDQATTDAPAPAHSAQHAAEPGDGNPR